jgi:hypothetical protein
MKSREKTIAITGIDVRGDEKSYTSKLRELLESAVS